ncbi:X-ray repair cross-complementing protein 6 [Blyttiomyces sp. JEL0837]|nr:X-ray repair cross-complementing protein 6 [Blyttiomyces sp. JEL0837]
MSWRAPYGSNEGEEEEIEEEEDDIQEFVEKGRDCVIFLVDASPNMHIPQDEENLTPFRKVLKACLGHLMGRIIDNDTDLVGIVFYGTEKANNSHNFENIYIYQELDAPYAKRISELERLEASRDVFDTEIGASNTYAFHEALWICNTMFSKQAKKNDTKRVFLATSNDNPNAGNLELQRFAFTRANDLQDMGGKIHLFSFHPPGGKFEFDIFFKDNIIKPEEGDDEEELRYADASGKLSQLIQQLRQREYKKRTACRIPFILGEDLEFGVMGYNLVTEAKLGSYTYLVGATNEEAKVVTSYICKTTGQQLSATDMSSYYPYGGRKVVFSKDEVAQMKTFGEPGLRLIGFKPLQVIMKKPYYNLKHSSFIFPDDASYKGSSSLFIQFLARVHALEKAVICSFIPRKNASPRLVALLPQLEQFDDQGNIAKPSGFHLVHIPFTDDIRRPAAPEFEAAKRIPELQPAVNVFAEIIDKVYLKNFSLQDFGNPTLQKHYANLQAIALKRDMAEDVLDYTLPDNEVIQKRIGKLVPKLMEALPEPEEEVVVPKTTKRKPADAGGEPKAKKPKAEVDGDAVKTHWENGTLKKLTVGQLTEFLNSVNIKPTKKKLSGFIGKVWSDLGEHGLLSGEENVTHAIEIWKLAFIHCYPGDLAILPQTKLPTLFNGLDLVTTKDMYQRLCMQILINFKSIPDMGSGIGSCQT